MTDQTIPDVTPEDMEHARSYVQDFLDSRHVNDRTLAVARVLQAFLPPPPRPTLADMTWEERRAHIGATAELCGELVIISDMDADHVRVVTEGFNPQWPELTSVTPRPDLPRFTWPTDTPAPAAPALPEGWRLADHPNYGRVIVTSPAPDAYGNVCFVAPVPGFIGNDWHLCDPDELAFLDQEADK